MTRRKQPWGQQRGWIVPADGSPPQELPQQMVGHKLISWAGTMPEKEPAKYYHSHVLNPEGVSVYVPEGRDAKSLPESIKNGIRCHVKGQSCALWICPGPRARSGARCGILVGLVT